MFRKHLKIIDHLRIHGLAIFIPLIIFLGIGLKGLDFGYHWDEGYHMRIVKRTFDEGRLLPGSYVYPSISYWLTLLGSLPLTLESGEWVLKNFPYPRYMPNFQPEIYRDPVKPFLNTPEYFGSKSHYLHMRAVFLLCSALMIIWVYAASWLLTKNQIGALFSSSIVATSWEFGYHARFIAPDAVCAQFVALTIFFLCKSILKSNRYVDYAAIAAGLAVGTKYPVGILILPVLSVLYFYFDRRTDIVDSITTTAFHARRVLYIFFGIFFITTPGALFEPFRFWSQFYDVSQYYVREGHHPYNVDVPWEHARLLIDYLATAISSPSLWGSLFVSILSLAGMVSLWNYSKPLLIVLMLFPILYFFGLSWAIVMNVRNSLTFLPYIALFGGQGVFWVSRLLRPAFSRIIFWGFVFCIPVYGAFFGYSAAETINQDERYFLTVTNEYILRHSSEKFVVVPTLFDEYAFLGKKPNNMHPFSMLTPDAHILFRRADIENSWKLPNLRPGYYERWFGEMSANRIYYANWHDAIFFMSGQKFLELQLLPKVLSK